MILKSALMDIFGFECECIKPPHERRWYYPTTDYTPLLLLVNIKPFDGEEYFIEGYKSYKFKSTEFDLDFSDLESYALESYGTESYSENHEELTLSALKTCTSLIEKFNEDNKGRDIIYAQNLYESDKGLSEGWKLINFTGKWKLCVNYRLI
ncbi:hypothetical protein 2018Mat002_0650 [Vibrio phage ICP1]|nr:hypothetical protein 2018Mat002_0650 [Vibrio phage ICP1]QVW07983.1 hypothetical protein 2019MatB_0650 [Vibrio phage ICP1]QVW08434.1 hypothetical protein 2019MatD_0650 [Vibrio phage ICP1]QVW08659.1 hypothetical protein 2019MatE_0665 [Vibrio phage ICP1]